MNKHKLSTNTVHKYCPYILSINTVYKTEIERERGTKTNKNDRQKTDKQKTDKQKTDKQKQTNKKQTNKKQTK